MTAAPPLAHDDRTAGTPARGAALLIGGVLLVLFVVGALSGYVYAHEPVAPELRTRLEPPAATPDTMLRGALATATTDFIEVSTAAGPQRLRVTPAVPVEELAPLTTAIPEGAPVNVGGHRTESGFVLTGVVVLPGGTP